MELTDALKGRRSIQKYQPTPVEYDKVVDIVEAGMVAPSAGNLHSCKYIVIVDQEKRKEIAEASLQQYWMSTAPVHIIVCAEIEKTSRLYGLRGERLYVIQDCAASIQNMLLAAYAHGLGTCWVGAFDEDMVKRLCNIPGNIRPQAIITIGYPDEKPQQKESYPVSEMFFFENWGGKIKDIHRVFREHSVEFQKAAKKIQSVAKKAKDALKK